MGRLGRREYRRRLQSWVTCETPIAGYTPYTDVTEHAKIDLDQIAMESYLSDSNFTGATYAAASLVPDQKAKLNQDHDKCTISHSDLIISLIMSCLLEQHAAKILQSVPLLSKCGDSWQFH